MPSTEPDIRRALADLRREYRQAALDETTADADPVRQFDRWIAEARRAGCHEPNAMTLATVTPAGTPAARTVLLKGFSEAGAAFFSNSTSAKGRELAATKAAALTFWWPALERQVRIEGPVVVQPTEEVDAYFRVRPRESQLGAWVSDQSAPITSRALLDAKLAEVRARFEGADQIPRPPHWFGYRVVLRMIEFWQGRPGRLHDRLRFTRPDADAPWTCVRLQP